MSSVPSINAFAAVHTRHHSGESQLKQTDQSKTVLSCTLETSSSSDNMPTCSSSNVKSDEKAKSTLFGRFGNFIGKLNLAGHDGVFFGTRNDQDMNKNSSQLQVPEETSILSRVRHLSGSSSSGDDLNPSITCTEKEKPH